MFYNRNVHMRSYEYHPPVSENTPWLENVEPSLAVMVLAAQVRVRRRVRTTTSLSHLHGRSTSTALLFKHFTSRFGISPRLFHPISNERPKCFTFSLRPWKPSLTLFKHSPPNPFTRVRKVRLMQVHICCTAFVIHTWHHHPFTSALKVWWNLCMLEGLHWARHPQLPFLQH